MVLIQCQFNILIIKEIKRKRIKFSVKILVVVVLLDPFRRIGAWRNSTETQQSGHAPRSTRDQKWKT